MWYVEEPKYEMIVNYTEKNPNIPYNLSLIENNKYEWNIQILREENNLQFPWYYTIFIQDAFKRSKSICEFEIENTLNVELVDILSDREGLGSIMFKLMIGIIEQVEVKLNQKIISVVGELSRLDKENKNWLKSIPFYCMKAYQYNYELFYFDENKIKYKFKKLDTSDMEKYNSALDFAQYFFDLTDSGWFEFKRN